MRIKFVLVSLFILLLTSCGSSSTSPSSPSSYIPLSVGNQWNNDINGFVIFASGDTLTISGTMVRKITGTATHDNGASCYISEDLMNITYTTPDTSFSFSDTTINYIAESDTQFLVYDDTLSTEFELLLKLPVTVGETWVPDPADDPDTVREVISITSSVSVPAGSFTNCLLTEDSDPSLPDDYWRMYFAPGIGPVKIEMVEVDDDYTEIIFNTTSYVVH